LPRQRGEPVTFEGERLAGKDDTVNRSDPVRNRRISEITPLLSPRHVREELPLSPAGEQVVLAGREQVSAILEGRDDRLLVVVGPCSVHDPVAATEYAERLRPLAAATSEQLLVVMRVYFEKPRTTLGWKGLINDPGLDGTYRVNDGLVAARKMLLAVLSLGLPAGCEFLDPITPQYIADAVSWGAIGARTSQSQVHRQLASGLSMPIGFKNSTEGDVQGAVDAVFVAASGQVFPGITDDGLAAIFSTSGNRDCHVVLRGSASGPNYDRDSVADVVDRLARSGLQPRVVVDASHGNSGKDHLRQAVVAAELAARVAEGDRQIAGVMLESFLVPGRQDLDLGRASELTYGQSITDACMGWESTVSVLDALAEAVARRRALVSSAS
jgi:3-deoxy-7-phosphoheptulonate synthase